ncbi:MAG: hypothetical protein OXD35_02835 [Thiotrichales bacterium]|nr:hypothetical protein [Thiotrichales bacterium]
MAIQVTLAGHVVDNLPEQFHVLDFMILATPSRRHELAGSDCRGVRARVVEFAIDSAQGGRLSLIARFPDQPPVELSGIAEHDARD